jgi:integrase
MRGQIIKKKDGVYLVRIQRTLKNGTRKSYSKQIRGTKKQAEQFLTEWLGRFDNNKFIENSNRTLNELLDKWLNSKNKARPQTLDSYERILRVHIRPRLGDSLLQEITDDDVNTVIGEMLKANYAARTINYAIDLLDMAFLYAVKKKFVSDNPCEYVEKPEMKKTKTRAFSPEQAEAFLAVCQDEKHGLIYETALISGCRPEEYLGLKWADVCFERNSIVIHHALVWHKGGRFTFDAPKTEASRRTIPLPEVLMKKLKKHRIQQAEHRLKLGAVYENLDLVFANEFGRPHHYRNLTQRHFDKILKKAGLSGLGFTPYSLRHSTATLLLASNENIKVISERLGHATTRMTSDTYIHNLPNQQESATEKLSDRFYRKTGT